MIMATFYLANAPCIDMKFSDVTSREVMEENGWSFENIGREFTRISNTRDDQCGDETWYGWKSPSSNKSGRVSVTFAESGKATLTYGNCWGQETVDVYFNDTKIDAAGANELDKKVSFDFMERTTLDIKTKGKAILKINSLKISCAGNTIFSVLLISYYDKSKIYF